MAWNQVAAARRFLASEQNATVRDWGGRFPIVLVYPNSYAVGMASLAVHALYGWLNERDSIVCERAFAWLGRTRARNTPPLTLESQRPIADAAVIAVSISFEMDSFYVIDLLRRAHIPVRATKRQEGDPLVLLGGPGVSANPEPLANLADAVVIGEVEPVLDSLLATLQESWPRGRLACLEALARLPGVYVPLIHHDQPIARLVLRDLDTWPVGSCIVAPRAEFGDMQLIEIARGCAHGCRFCLAGRWYRPRRERSLGSILKQIEFGAHRWPRVGLVAASVSDYSRIEPLVQALRDMGRPFSVSSLRISPLSERLIAGLVESGARSITLAPEAGSQRLRDSIRKGISHDDILRAIEQVRDRFEQLKLYFMVGLPGETETDITALTQLLAEVRGLCGRQIVINLSPFVPKAHTPFERAPMAPPGMLTQRIKVVREAARSLNIEVRAESVLAARIQGILARGSREVGDVLLDLEQPSAQRFARALEDRGWNLDDLTGAIAPDQPLPWDKIGVRVHRDRVET